MQETDGMSPSLLRQPARRTIGLLTANIHIGAARSLWRGALDGAHARNANLICFPGGRLHISHDFEAERNIIYDLIDLEHLDGLVNWTSAMAGSLDPSELQEFHNRFRSIPVVSLAQRITDGPHAATVAGSHPRLAHDRRLQRPCRSHEPAHQEDKARRARLPKVRQLSPTLSLPSTIKNPDHQS